jgi:hypothetical protein
MDLCPEDYWAPIGLKTRLQAMSRTGHESRLRHYWAPTAWQVGTSIIRYCASLHGFVLGTLLGTSDLEFSEVMGTSLRSLARLRSTPDHLVPQTTWHSHGLASGHEL